MLFRSSAFTHVANRAGSIAFLLNNSANRSLVPPVALHRFAHHQESMADSVAQWKVPIQQRRLPLATTVVAVQPIQTTVVGAALERQTTRHRIMDAQQIQPLHHGRILRMVTVVGVASVTLVQHLLIVATLGARNPPHSQQIPAAAVGDASVIRQPRQVDSSRKAIRRMKACSAQTSRIAVHVLWNRNPGSSNNSRNRSNNNRKWSSVPNRAATTIRVQAAWNAGRLKAHG